MVRFTGRAFEITTVPNKPTPTGLKVWSIAQRGFLLAWEYHRPGKKGGPVGVRKPKQINKTQAVIPHLLAKLPKAYYHVYMDNLFTSTELFIYLKKLGHAATGTCRTSSGVLTELVELKKKDGGKVEDQLEWGTMVAYPEEQNQVLHCGWKDNAFALAMSTFHRPEGRVTRLRKRPKGTSSNAKTARKPFGIYSEKELDIPVLYDEYNHNMGPVDVYD
jgi:hypothetical protein